MHWQRSSEISFNLPEWGMWAFDVRSCKKELIAVGILLVYGGPVYDSIFTLETDGIL